MKTRQENVDLYKCSLVWQIWGVILQDYWCMNMNTKKMCEQSSLMVLRAWTLFIALALFTRRSWQKFMYYVSGNLYSISPHSSNLMYFEVCPLDNSNHYNTLTSLVSWALYMYVHLIITSELRLSPPHHLMGRVDHHRQRWLIYT